MKNSNFLFTFALALLVIFQSCKKNKVAEVPVPTAVAQTENIAVLTQAISVRSCASIVLSNARSVLLIAGSVMFMFFSSI